MARVALNNELTAFKNFARRDGVSADQAVEFTWNGEVTNASHSANAVSRFFAITSDAQAAKDINRYTRSAFLNALKRQFNAQSYRDLPDYVKAALRGTHANTGDEDFGLDGAGAVQSTKPLTARRIRFVMEAIENHGARESVSANPITQDVVDRRLEKLNEVIDDFYDKLTKDVADPVEPGATHPPVYVKFFEAPLKRYIRTFVFEPLAKVGCRDDDNDKMYTINEAKLKYRKLLTNGMGGLLNAYWNGGTASTTVTYGGEVVRNRVAYHRFLDNLFNDFVNEFNQKNPDLAIRMEA